MLCIDIIICQYLLLYIVAVKLIDVYVVDKKYIVRGLINKY